MRVQCACDTCSTRARAAAAVFNNQRMRNLGWITLCVGPAVRLAATAAAAVVAAAGRSQTASVEGDAAGAVASASTLSVNETSISGPSLGLSSIYATGDNNGQSGASPPANNPAGEPASAAPASSREPCLLRAAIQSRNTRAFELLHMLSFAARWRPQPREIPDAATELARLINPESAISTGAANVAEVVAAAAILESMTRQARADDIHANNYVSSSGRAATPESHFVSDSAEVVRASPSVTAPTSPMSNGVNGAVVLTITSNEPSSMTAGAPDHVGEAQTGVSDISSSTAAPATVPQMTAAQRQASMRLARERLLQRRLRVLPLATLYGDNAMNRGAAVRAGQAYRCRTTLTGFDEDINASSSSESEGERVRTVGVRTSATNKRGGKAFPTSKDANTAAAATATAATTAFGKSDSLSEAPTVSVAGAAPGTYITVATVAGARNDALLAAARARRHRRRAGELLRSADPEPSTGERALAACYSGVPLCGLGGRKSAGYQLQEQLAQRQREEALIARALVILVAVDPAHVLRCYERFVDPTPFKEAAPAGAPSAGAATAVVAPATNTRGTVPAPAAAAAPPSRSHRSRRRKRVCCCCWRIRTRSHRETSTAPTSSASNNAAQNRNQSSNAASPVTPFAQPQSEKYELQRESMCAWSLLPALLLQLTLIVGTILVGIMIALVFSVRLAARDGSAGVWVWAVGALCGLLFDWFITTPLSLSAIAVVAGCAAHLRMRLHGRRRREIAREMRQRRRAVILLARERVLAQLRTMRGRGPQGNGEVVWKARALDNAAASGNTVNNEERARRANNPLRNSTTSAVPMVPRGTHARPDPSATGKLTQKKIVIAIANRALNAAAGKDRDSHDPSASAWGWAPIALTQLTARTAHAAPALAPLPLLTFAGLELDDLESPSAPKLRSLKNHPGIADLLINEANANGNGDRQAQKQRQCQEVGKPVIVQSPPPEKNVIAASPEQDTAPQVNANVLVLSAESAGPADPGIETNVVTAYAEPPVAAPVTVHVAAAPVCVQEPEPVTNALSGSVPVTDGSDFDHRRNNSRNRINDNANKMGNGAVPVTASAPAPLGMAPPPPPLALFMNNNGAPPTEQQMRQYTENYNALVSYYMQQHQQQLLAMQQQQQPQQQQQQMQQYQNMMSQQQQQQIQQQVQHQAPPQPSHVLQQPAKEQRKPLTEFLPVLQDNYKDHVSLSRGGGETQSITRASGYGSAMPSGFGGGGGSVYGGSARGGSAMSIGSGVSQAPSGQQQKFQQQQMRMQLIDLLLRQHADGFDAGASRGNVVPVNGNVMIAPLPPHQPSPRLPSPHLMSPRLPSPRQSPLQSPFQLPQSMHEPLEPMPQHLANSSSNSSSSPAREAACNSVSYPVESNDAPMVSVPLTAPETTNQSHYGHTVHITDGELEPTAPSTDAEATAAKLAAAAATAAAALTPVDIVTTANLLPSAVDVTARAVVSADANADSIVPSAPVGDSVPAAITFTMSAPPQASDVVADSDLMQQQQQQQQQQQHSHQPDRAPTAHNPVTAADDGDIIPPATGRDFDDGLIVPSLGFSASAAGKPESGSAGVVRAGSSQSDGSDHELSPVATTDSPTGSSCNNGGSNGSGCGSSDESGSGAPTRASVRVSPLGYLPMSAVADSGAEGRVSSRNGGNTDGDGATLAINNLARLQRLQRAQKQQQQQHQQQ